MEVREALLKDLKRSCEAIKTAFLSDDYLSIQPYSDEEYLWCSIDQSQKVLRQYYRYDVSHNWWHTIESKIFDTTWNDFVSILQEFGIE